MNIVSKYIFIVFLFVLEASHLCAAVSDDTMKIMPPCYQEILSFYEGTICNKTGAWSKLKEQATNHRLAEAFMSTIYCMWRNKDVGNRYWDECKEWIKSEGRMGNPYAHYCFGIRLNLEDNYYGATQEFYNAAKKADGLGLVELKEVATIRFGNMYLSSVLWDYLAFHQPLELLKEAECNSKSEKFQAEVKRLRLEILVRAMQAKEKYVIGARTGNVDAQFELGMILMQYGEYDEASEWLELAKKNGNKDAESEIKKVIALKSQGTV